MMWIVSLCRSRLVAVIAEAASRHGTASQVKVSTRLLLRGLRRVPTINLSHDFFSPPDRILGGGWPSFEANDGSSGRCTILADKSSDIDLRLFCQPTSQTP